MYLSHKTQITSGQWLWCERQNGTYLDCPVSKSPQSTHLIVTHNPAMVDQKYMKVKVPHGNYQVSVWNVTQQTFVAVSKAAVICVMRVVESGALVNDCDMHIKTLIPAGDFALVKLTYNDQVDITVKESSTGSISGNGESLIFRTYDDDGVHFDMLKDASGNIYKLAFDIRNYFSYQGQGTGPKGCDSGAYLFRPSNDL